ncbi:hypothetical protein LQ567_02735 [Niabella pedocola]|uniref:HEAT repeat domain-containing protein n=1 Tax=Niabella pedocola TaxID=1752077 RepID=A0ABS8PLB4_9BACT|nr:hypothetical protein [Niabella pedocola]MCD2421660.1 hypothetical protein [Niabella pedocola]
MNLPVLLSASIRKETVAEIVEWIGADQKRFAQLFLLFSKGERRVVQRAAWPMSYCVIRYPELITPHYGKIIRLLNDPAQPAAVKRNILRLMDQSPEVPKKFHGPVMDNCFRILEDPEETIAARAFAIGILSRMTDVYPEILPELKTAVAFVLPNASPGVRSRALKVLKKK